MYSSFINRLVRCAFGVVAVQVDMRYRSINDSTYSIAVQLNGYYIATVRLSSSSLTHYLFRASVLDF